MSAIHLHAWHNGRRVSSGGIALSPLQAGLLTGWGLFSTLRIYQGVPFAWEHHWERLRLDAAALRVSSDGVREQAEQGLADLIACNGAEEAVARIYLIRNQGGLLNPKSAAASASPAFPPTDLLVFTMPLRQWGATAALKLQPHGRHAAAPLAGTKTLTWAHNLVQV
ncbi:MAG: aminotransferase class IV, partial [Terriglobales bacterium]